MQNNEIPQSIILLNTLGINFLISMNATPFITIFIHIVLTLGNIYTKGVTLRGSKLNYLSAGVHVQMIVSIAYTACWDTSLGSGDGGGGNCGRITYAWKDQVNYRKWWDTVFLPNIRAWTT